MTFNLQQAFMCLCTPKRDATGWHIFKSGRAATLDRDIWDISTDIKIQYCEPLCTKLKSMKNDVNTGKKVRFFLVHWKSGTTPKFWAESWTLQPGRDMRTTAWCGSGRRIKSSESPGRPAGPGGLPPIPALGRPRMTQLLIRKVCYKALTWDVNKRVQKQNRPNLNSPYYSILEFTLASRHLYRPNYPWNIMLMSPVYWMMRTQSLLISFILLRDRIIFLEEAGQFAAGVGCGVVLMYSLPEGISCTVTPAGNFFLASSVDMDGITMQSSPSFQSTGVATWKLMNISKWTTTTCLRWRPLVPTPHKVTPLLSKLSLKVRILGNKLNSTCMCDVYKMSTQSKNITGGSTWNCVCRRGTQIRPKVTNIGDWRFSASMATLNIIQSLMKILQWGPKIPLQWTICRWISQQSVLQVTNKKLMLV